MKKLLFRLTILAALGLGVWAGLRFYRQMPQSQQQQIPTARARRGDVVVRSFTRAELRAVRSVTLVAPNLFGTVQVTKLAPLGSFAREKDLVVEFDDSEVLSRLEEKTLEIEQVDEQVKKSQAELAIRENQDQVELLQARYSVRRGDLEVKRNELLSAIDAKKNILNLEEARRRLTQLESDIKSRREQAQAELNTLRERKNKANVEMARERSRLNQVKLLSSISGLVAIKQQRSGYFTSGSQIPDIREGDQVPPGSPVAEVMDISEMEAVARVVEVDRANLREGQDVILRLDALSDKSLNGKIKALSGTASSNVFSSDPTKRFEVVLSVDMRQLLSALGARPEQIARVLTQAEQNRWKPASPSMGGMVAGMLEGGGPQMMILGGRGAGAPGGGMPGGAGEGPPGAMVQFRGGGAGGGTGGGGRGGFGGGSEEQRQQMREALQKALGGRNMQDLSEEERQKVFASIRGGGGGRPEGERKGGRGERGQGAPGEPGAIGLASQEGGGGRRREGGGGRRGEGGPPGGPGQMTAMFSAQQFSEKDLAEAKLPPPPEEENQLDVLMRPGLLADVEIIVEKISNVLSIPVQAIFEKSGKQVVFVKTGARFDERVVKPLKRSESLMLIAEGLKPGEIVALADPTERPGGRKKKGEPEGGAGGGPMPMGGKS